MWNISPIYFYSWQLIVISTLLAIHDPRVFIALGSFYLVLRDNVETAFSSGHCEITNQLLINRMVLFCRSFLRL